MAFSQRADKVSQALVDLEFVLRTEDFGTAAEPNRMKLLDRAAQNLEDWLPDNHAGAGEPQFEVGGSSSPAEQDERREIALNEQKALVDDENLRVLVNTIAAYADRVRGIVVRASQKVVYSKLPADVPGCRSCARSGSQHFAPVRETAKRHGLCDACYRFANAARSMMGAKELTKDHYPPVQWCDLRHRVGAQAAGRWLAQQSRKAS